MPPAVNVKRNFTLMGACLVSAVAYFAPVVAPIIAGAAHRAYHISEGIRLQHEIAQRRAIEAILTPHDEGTQHAHLDSRSVHTHFAGDTPHSHSAGVDLLLAAASDDESDAIGAPPSAPSRLASHVPARSPLVPSGWVAAQTHGAGVIAGPAADAPELIDPPPRF
jgi:hypothetical protein